MNSVSLIAWSALVLPGASPGRAEIRLVDAPPDQPDVIRPWGHLTGGGTVANIEALWSARNLKFFPVALQAALQQERSLQAAAALE